MTITLLTHDCATVELKENTYDALLCDPPYGLEFMGKSWDKVVPPASTWKHLAKALKPGAPLLIFGGTRTFHRLAVALEDAGLEVRDTLCWLYAEGFPKGKSALKPAWEPIILARKPGKTTLNIQGARLDSGRWPSNLLLDEDAAQDLDQTTGPLLSRPFKENTATGSVLPLKKRTAGGYSDSGGASRYFYTAKASKKERGEGNDHPTVKPLKLTTYLAKLILPPLASAHLLVPFAGSGSEIIGAREAGWAHITGVEVSPPYVEIARKRLGLP